MSLRAFFLRSKNAFLLRKKIERASRAKRGVINERISLNKIVYSVQSYKDLANVIIPHFDNYPLITKKKADYILFKQAINLINLKAHLNIEGFINILSLKASMNSGLSDKLVTNFNVIPAARPIIEYEGIHDPN